MRLVKNKDSILVLRDQFPRRMSLSLGLPLCSIGALLLVFANQVAILDCYREIDIPTCEIRRERLGHNETNAIIIPQRSLIQAHREREGDTTYRVAIESNQGIFPITTIHTNGYDDKRQLRDQIEQFIADPSQTSFTISINFYMFYPLGVDFSLFGLTLIAPLFRHTMYRFDRTQNQFSIERRIWDYYQKQTDSLSSVQAVPFEEKIDSDGDSLYRISIFLDTGNRLGSKSYHNYFSRKDYEKVVQSINTFLGLLPSKNKNKRNLNS